MEITVQMREKGSFEEAGGKFSFQRRAPIPPREGLLSRRKKAVDPPEQILMAQLENVCSGRIQYRGFWKSKTRKSWTGKVPHAQKQAARFAKVRPGVRIAQKTRPGERKSPGLEKVHSGNRIDGHLSTKGKEEGVSGKTSLS